MDAERSELLPITRPAPTIAGPAKAADAPRLPDDSVEQALGHCERLLDAVDSGRRRMAVVRAVSAVTMAVVVLAIVLGTIAGRGSLTVWVAAVIASGAFLCLVATVSRQLLVTLRGQIRRDELTMVDLIGRQRELVPLLARNEKWTSARVYLTEKRLERFPVDASPPDQHRGFRQ